MTSKNSRLGLPALFGVALLALGASASPAGAETQEAARSRLSAAPSSTRATSAPSAPASASRGRAAVTRSPSTGSSPSGTRERVSGRSTYGRGHQHPGFYGSRRGYFGHPIGYHGRYGYYGPRIGLSFGLGWWGGYWPYYYGYPAYYGPQVYHRGAPARLAAAPVGAFDLNVKPKKTQVWVDGRYVGTAGRFDGFPDYLWLAEGEHQLTFYLEGYQTVERRVETLAAVVADLRLDMVKGASTPVAPPAPPPPPAMASKAPATPSSGKGVAATSPAVGGPLDARAAPGRLVLRVEPEDASVYLDGRFLGTGRDLARLHAGLLVDGGDHRLEVVRPGFDSRSIDFTVTAGEEERIEVGLEKG